MLLSIYFGLAFLCTLPVPLRIWWLQARRHNREAHDTFVAQLISVALLGVVTVAFLALYHR